MDYFNGNGKFIKKFKELLEAEYEIFDKGIDNFIDEDTGEIYIRISHVLDGNSQEAIKLGIERDIVYVEYETYSDDTAIEGFESWGFSIMKCSVQDGYSPGELGCYVLYCNDSQTRLEKIQFKQ